MIDVEDDAEREMHNHNGLEGGDGEPVELVIFVDSNQRHVKWDLFWRSTGKRIK